MGDTARTPIQEFFHNSYIFITGGTGFVGLALIEKLLRTCSVNTIYLLIRPKKGKEPSERLQEIQKNLVFERLIEERGTDIFNKLKAVGGDVGEENLGLSEADRQLLINNANIVFHSAATLDFESPLKPNVQINLLGTRRVIELCHQIRNFKALLHVSSAYVNSNRKKVDEVIYPAPENPERLIELCNTQSDEAIETMTPSLIKDLPNSYALTKALAEHEVSKAGFPAAIVRPSMITAAWTEPVPGWTISKNGPTGFLMGAAKGVVRRLPLGVDLIQDYIPIDIVVNECLAAVWFAGTTRPSSVPVYHCTSGTYNPFRWSSCEHKVNSFLHRYPLKSAVWYPYLKFLPSLWLFQISSIFVHFMPAYILDFVARLFGGRPILVRLHTNVNRSLKRLEPFIFNEWFYNNNKSLELHNNLNEKDKQLFNLDIGSLNWMDYFDDTVRGVRRYLNNEDPKTIPAAKRKDNILMVLHLVLQAGLLGLVWWLTASFLGRPFTSTGWVVIAAYILFNFL